MLSGGVTTFALISFFIMASGVGSEIDFAMDKSIWVQLIPFLGLVLMVFILCPGLLRIQVFGKPFLVNFHRTRNR